MAASSCGDVSLVQGLIRVEGKLDAEKYRANLSKELFRSTQDFNNATTLKDITRMVSGTP